MVEEYFDVYLIGYGNDNKNSVFVVMLPERLNEYYINYDEKRPFKIKDSSYTVSISDSGKPKIDKPIKLRGRLGYFIKDDDRGYIFFNDFSDRNY